MDPEMKAARRRMAAFAIFALLLIAMLALMTDTGAFR